jgi:hypothetical protein
MLDVRPIPPPKPKEEWIRVGGPGKPKPNKLNPGETIVNYAPLDRWLI